MKKNILIIVLALIIIGIAAGLVYYFNSGPGGATKQVEQDPVVPGADQPERILEKNNFSILVPAGWEEVSAPPGVSTMIASVNEDIIDPVLEELNFKSYYAISYDIAGGRSLKEYADYIKEEILNVTPEVNFTAEHSQLINGRDGYALEADLSQQGVDFKVIIIMVEGKNDEIWSVAYNTGSANWPAYQDLFGRISQSFVLLE